MEKKVGDLTLYEIKKMCKENDELNGCASCPLRNISIDCSSLYDVKNQTLGRKIKIKEN